VSLSLPAVAATLMLLSSAGAALAEEPAPPPARQQLILLKADDFGRSAPWQRYVSYIRDNNLKASLGIICRSLEKDDPKLVAWVQELLKTEQFDFWHHGYDHRLNFKEGDRTLCEFRGTPYEQQLDHFDRACTLAREKLGIKFQVFGAPGNAVDDTTARVLAQHPEIKGVFYGPAKVTTAHVFQRWANLEMPTFVPNSAGFIERYKWNASRPYLALQMHPGNWNDERFAEFEKIIAFLKTQNVRFVTAAELCKFLDETEPLPKAK
jgi:peptidoglycan/xylan/chitin deacetylase (PgdA/CDA1 family)